MYAGEIALNHVVPDLTLADSSLDHPAHSKSKMFDSTIFHVHSYHVEELFNKFELYDGKYDTLTSLSPGVEVRSYALEMALRGNLLKSGPIIFSTKDPLKGDVEEDDDELARLRRELLT
jgi:hypothetical protein